MKEKTDNIDILEILKRKIKEQDSIIASCSYIGNKKAEAKERTEYIYMLRYIENLIAENKELKDINFRMAYNTIKNEEIKLDNYIEKSKVEELIEELRNDTCKIINRTYIPTISSKLFNNNREKYEPMLEARNILINALNKLQSLLGKE